MVGVSDVENLEFEWGTKKGVGGQNKDVHFYYSFLYDGKEYSLYDCIYIFREGVSEPDIGKIIKMWETSGKSKKVKILWFFRPSEITNFLGSVQYEENEIFLASGKGDGLANVNPLEAIAGKCNVICTSKDSRNPHPSAEVINEADFVFHRTFDVQRQIILELDNFEEKIAETEVENIFNQLRFLETTSKPKPAENANDTAADAIHPLLEGSCGVGSRPHKKAKLENTAVDTQFSKSKIHKTNDSRNASNSRGSQPDAFSLEVEPKLNYEEKLKLKKDSDGAVNSFKTQKVNKSMDNVKDGHQILKDERPDDVGRSGVEAKPLKVSAVQSPNHIQKTHDQGSGHISKLNKVTEPAAASKLHVDSSIRSQKDKQKAGEKRCEVAPRPDDERRKWFKDLPWEEKLQNAQKDGTVILLHNLDPSYTSSEVEDIVWNALNESCEAKMIQQTAYQSPNTGQALIVLDTQEAVERVLRKLREGCLLLSNGRPLVASSPSLCLSGKQTPFVGHLALEKLKHQMPREMSEAVSTSHCSQPNTLEYDMAMDWCLLTERSDFTLKILFKRQEREFSKLQANLKTK